ncbi:MAG: BREX-6 system BrxE protein [Polyangiales bacterium]
MESALDEILAVQVTVAWAGERGEPARLAWWNSDLVDPEGGGYLFRKLLPRTGEWAALATVREVARRADAAGRQKLGDPDQVRTLFSLGFELDERLDERLRDLKRRGAPTDALPWPVSLERYSLDDLRYAFRHGPAGAPPFDVVAGGRQLKTAPETPTLGVKHLAAVLFAGDAVPREYPLPFYRARA